jgi:hypothetical protein
MKSSRLLALVALLSTLVAAPASAQVGISPHVGTLGLGADVSIGLLPILGIRAGGNIQPWKPKLDFDELEYTIDLASPTWFGVVDLYFAGPLRLSGGAVAFTNDTKIDARVTQAVDIGDATYTPEQIGSIAGVFEANRVAPYAGLGFGKAPRSKGVGFSMDLGVAFHGEPTVRLTASGPFADDPVFQSNLTREEANVQDDAKSFRVYPVVAVGFVIAF